MYKRGHTKEAEKSERIEENLKKITGGKKNVLKIIMVNKEKLTFVK